MRDNGEGVKRYMFNKLIYLTLGIIIVSLSPHMAFALVGTSATSSNSVLSGSTASIRGETGDIEWVKKATQKYSPDSWNILMQYENLPVEMEGNKKGGWLVSIKKAQATFDLLRNTSGKAEILARMAVNVHCITLTLQRFLVFQHARENKLLMDWERAEAFFYLSPAKSFYVSFPIQSLFPAGRLVPEITDNMKTPLFDEYIRRNSNAQRFGVIGLLEEFHALYFKSKYYLDMLEAYKIAEGSDADGLLEWVRHSTAAMNAFYEFEFFFHEYFLYMKENHAVDYAALKSCRSFVAAYGALRVAYEDLVKEYEDLIRLEMTRLNTSGKAQAGLENNILWVRTASSSKSKGAKVLPQKDKLMPVLNSGRYRTIMPDFPKI